MLVHVGHIVVMLLSLCCHFGALADCHVVVCHVGVMLVHVGHCLVILLASCCHLVHWMIVMVLALC